MSKDRSKEHITDKISRSLGTFIWRRHARREAENDDIGEAELEDALRKGFTLVEHYPEDPCGESALVLIHVGDKSVHVVLSPREDLSYLITVYMRLTLGNGTTALRGGKDEEISLQMWRADEA